MASSSVVADTAPPVTTDITPLVTADTAPLATADPVPTIVVAPIEVDDNVDGDSTFESEAGSNLNYGSITSSIYNYRQENGRTYHAYSDGKYQLPNDENEQVRMDIAYHAILVMFEGKPFFAPVKNPQRILDMGTGTGIWALDTGDQYPEAHVIGIDLSPIQPKWTAPNVEFRVDDIDQPWVFDSPFDLIHSRVCSGIAIQSWPKYLEESFKHLRPGGWVEAQECVLEIHSDDGTLKADSKILRWHQLLCEGLLLAGRNMLHTAEDVKQFMEEAGFINVTIYKIKMAISPWPKDKRHKEAASYAMLSMLEGMSGVGLAVFTRLLGWTPMEHELFVAEVKKEWMQKGTHAYWPMYSVYGQKPEAKTEEDKVEVEVGPEAGDA